MKIIERKIQKNLINLLKPIILTVISFSLMSCSSGTNTQQEISKKETNTKQETPSQTTLYKNKIDIVVKQYKKDLISRNLLHRNSPFPQKLFLYRLGLKVDPYQEKSRDLIKNLKLYIPSLKTELEEDGIFISLAQTYRASLGEAISHFKNEINLILTLYTVEVFSEEEINKVSEKLVKKELYDTLKTSPDFKGKSDDKLLEMINILKENQPAPYFKRKNEIYEYVRDYAYNREILSTVKTKPLHKINIKFKDGALIFSEEEEWSGLNLSVHTEVSLNKNFEDSLNREEKTNIEKIIFTDLFSHLAKALNKKYGDFNFNYELTQPPIYDLSKKDPVLNCSLTKSLMNVPLNSYTKLYRPIKLDLDFEEPSSSSPRLTPAGKEFIAFQIGSFFRFLDQEGIYLKDSDFQDIETLALKIKSKKGMLKYLVTNVEQLIQNLGQNNEPLGQDFYETKLLQDLSLSYYESMVIETLFNAKDLIFNNLGVLTDYTSYKTELRKKAFAKTQKSFLEPYDPRQVIYHQDQADDIRKDLSFLETSFKYPLSKESCDKILASSIKAAQIYSDNFKQLDLENFLEKYLEAQKSISISTETEKASKMLQSQEDFPLSLEEQKQKILNHFKIHLASFYSKKFPETQEEREKIVQIFIKSLKPSSEIQQLATEKIQSSVSLQDELKDENKTFAYKTFLDLFYRSVDPYANLDVGQEFLIQMGRQKFGGIGAVLEKKSEDSFIKVKSVIPGGPASQYLKKNDLITHYKNEKEEWVSVKNKTVGEVVGKLRGELNTKLEIRVKKDGKTESPSVEYSLIRAAVKIPIYTPLSIFEVLSEKTGEKIKVGVITIRDFPAGVSSKVKEALEKAKEKQVQSIIIDLRSNPGGALQESVSITGLFLGEGNIAMSVSSDNKEIYRDRDPETYWTGPTTILVNEYSASASEVFSGALKDYKRALVIGSPHTYGKFTVQDVSSLNHFLYGQGLDDDVLNRLSTKYIPKLTTQFYFNPHGEFLHGKGVNSHITLSELSESKVKNNSLFEEPSQDLLPQPFLSPDHETNPQGEWLKVEEKDIEYVTQSLSVEKASISKPAKLVESGKYYDEDMFNEENQPSEVLLESVGAAASLYESQQK